MRRGAYTGEGGRIQRGHHFTQTNMGPGPCGALFDTTMFQYKQSRKKLKSLWGKKVVGRVVYVAWEPYPQPTGGGVGLHCQHGKGRWHQE